MRRFVSVLKPGIIFGNAVTMCGGFFLGSAGRIDVLTLLLALLGMSLVIGSGCVFNNVIDRDIDHLMERTKNRPLVQGLITPQLALIYGTILGVLGFLELYYTTNLLTVFMAAIGFFFYVVVYSMVMKRKASSGTVIGAVSGAIPPVVGYTAITNHLDLGAILLFLILFFWQMPHFYAIAIYRLKDYKNAGIPVLPIRRNIHYTKISMLLFTLAFTIAAIAPSYFEYAGHFYAMAALALGFIWVIFAVQGLFTKQNEKWARKMFLYSIINITLLCIVMAFK